MKGKQGLIDRVLKALKNTVQSESDTSARQLSRAEQKIQEINEIVKNLYKEKLSGKMPETFFYSLLSDYEGELKSLEETMPALKEKADAEAGQDENVQRFVDTISRYLNVERIDRFMARELIDFITVSEFYKVDGKTMQDVTINYKFVGNLERLLGKSKDAA